MTWFVLRVRHQQEREIADAILELGYRSFCPVYRSEEVIRGRKITKLRPVWATYVLADWPDDGGTSWHNVMDLDGVSSVIGGIEPTPVQESEIAELLAQVDNDGVVASLDALIERIKRGFGRGDRVRIEGGPFDGYQGTCDWFTAKGVSININALHGQIIRLYVPSDEQVRVVSDGNSAAPKTKSGTRRARRRLVMEDRNRTKSRKDFVRKYS